MRIDIDLDDDRIVSSPGVRDAVRLVQFKRDTSAELQVRFYRGGVQTELPAGASGKFGVKPAGQYDAEALVFAESWIQSGTGNNAVYNFSPAFDGAALAALLGSGDNDATNDEDYIVGMLEIKWTAEGKKHRTQTVETWILNDVLKDTDGTPLALPTPEEWLQARRPAPAYSWEYAPSPGAFATTVINPPGTYNNIRLTAMLEGYAGNNINFSLSPSPLATAITVDVANGTDIVVHYLPAPAIVSNAIIFWNDARRHQKALSAATTFTFYGVTDAQVLEIYLSQPTGASWPVTWPAGITWVAGAPGVIAAGTTIKVILTATSFTTFAGSFTNGATIPNASSGAAVIAAIRFDQAASALVNAEDVEGGSGPVAEVFPDYLVDGLDPNPPVIVPGQILFVGPSDVYIARSANPSIWLPITPVTV